MAGTCLPCGLSSPHGIGMKKRFALVSRHCRAAGTDIATNIRSITSTAFRYRGHSRYSPSRIQVGISVPSHAEDPYHLIARAQRFSTTQHAPPTPAYGRFKDDLNNTSGSKAVLIIADGRERRNHTLLIAQRWQKSSPPWPVEPDWSHFYPAHRQRTKAEEAFQREQRCPCHCDRPLFRA